MISLRDILAFGLGAVLAISGTVLADRYVVGRQLTAAVQAGVSDGLAPMADRINDWNKQQEEKRKANDAFAAAVKPWAMDHFKLTGDPRDVLDARLFKTKGGVMCGEVKPEPFDGHTFAYVLVDDKGVTDTHADGTDRTRSLRWTPKFGQWAKVVPCSRG